MNKILVSPSVLSADFAHMAEDVHNIEKWGADLVHCDVMDGVFVPNITFGMPMISAIKKHTNLPLDVHLMIINPEKYISHFAEAGADIITFHPDATVNPLDVLLLIKSLGKKCGLVFNPNIDHRPYQHLFSHCDLIVVMSVQAGFGGQSFRYSALEVLKDIKQYLVNNNLNVDIEIDGGINIENALLAIANGASILVAGSAVFSSSSPSQTIAKLRG